MKKETTKKVAVGAAVCLMLGVGATALMGMSAPGGMGGMDMADFEDAASQKTVVETTNARVGDIVSSGSFVGTVEPGQQVEVYSKVSGEITAANFSVGDTVQKGDVLMKVDSTTMELQVAQTQASISSAQAVAQYNLSIAEKDAETHEFNVEKGYDSAELSAEAAVKSAENQLESAYQSLSTVRRNLNDYITQEFNSYTEYTGSYSSKVDELEELVSLAEISYEAAQLNLDQAEDNLRATRMQNQEKAVSIEDSVELAKLNTDFTDQQLALQQLQVSLSDYTTAAPISGIIEQKNVDLYGMASAQTVAYVISNKDALTISYMVSESALESMSLGDTVRVEKDGETCEGTISEISTMASSANGLYTVKSTLTDAPFTLRSGSTVKVYADTQKAESELLLPIDAVYYDNGEAYVYVLEGNAAKRVDIEVGITDDTYIQVKSGIGLSDDVIVTWSASLYDGAEVYLPGTVPDADADGETPVGPDVDIPNADEGAEGPAALDDDADDAAEEASA